MDDTESKPNFFPSRTAMKALAAFAPRFREASATAGKWHQPESTTLAKFDSPELRAAGVLPTTKVTVAGWFEFSPMMDEFFHMAYDMGWVVSFDWSEWSQTPEGQSLIDDPVAISRATPEQLVKLLTAYLRRDRFCEGTLEEGFKSGILTAAAERASALLEATPEDPA